MLGPMPRRALLDGLVGRRVLFAVAAALAVIAIAVGLTGPAESGHGIRIEYDLEADGTDRSRDLGTTVDAIRRRLDRAAAGRELQIAVWAKDRVTLELAGADPEVYQELRTLLVRDRFLQLARIDPDAEFFALLHAHTTLVAPPGVKAETEAWPMVEGHRRATADRFLRGPRREVIERYVAEQARANPAYAAPPSRRIAYEELRAPGEPTGWRTHVIEDTSWLTGASIRDATFGLDPQTSQPQIIVELDDAARDKFGQLTRDHVGDKLAIVLDGEIHSAPLISSAIPGGRIAISMGGTDPRIAERDARHLAAVLSSGSLPGTLVERSVVAFETSTDGIRWHVLAPLGLIAIALVIGAMVKR